MIDIVRSLIAYGKSTLFSSQLAMQVLAEAKHDKIFLPVAMYDF